MTDNGISAASPQSRTVGTTSVTSSLMREMSPVDMLTGIRLSWLSGQGPLADKVLPRRVKPV